MISPGVARALANLAFYESKVILLALIIAVSHADINDDTLSAAAFLLRFRQCAVMVRLSGMRFQDDKGYGR